MIPDKVIEEPKSEAADLIKNTVNTTINNIEIKKLKDKLMNEKDNVYDDQEVIKKEVKEEIKKVNKDEISLTLDSLNNISLKFGECVFKINYINKGQRRFSATCINEG